MVGSCKSGAWCCRDEVFDLGFRALGTAFPPFLVVVAPVYEPNLKEVH